MNQYKKYLTEATIASLAVIYFYFVYLIGETGRLNSYGIYDTSSLITLELQNIIIGFISSIGYFIVFIVIFFIFTMITDSVAAKLPIKQKRHRKQFTSFVATTLGVGIFVYTFRNEMSLTFALMAMSLTIIFSASFHFLKSRKFKKTYYELFNGKFDSFFKVGKDDSTSVSLSRLILITFPMILIMVPAVNYYINFNTLKSAGYKSLQLSSYSGKNYVLARQYSDKNILVRMENSALLPEFVVLRGDEMKITEFKVVNMRIDTSKLSQIPEPVSKTDSQVKHFIKRILNIEK